ncbi:hypothetical protein LTS18_014368, partial [Coniosporium uncinatum]
MSTPRSSKRRRLNPVDDDHNDDAATAPPERTTINDTPKPQTRGSLRRPTRATPTPLRTNGHVRVTRTEAQEEEEEEEEEEETLTPRTLKYSMRKGGNEDEALWDDIDGALEGSARATRRARRGGRGGNAEKKEEADEEADELSAVVDCVGEENGQWERSKVNGSANRDRELAREDGTLLAPSARARRRSNRTDHIGNGGEGVDEQFLGDVAAAAAAATPTKRKGFTKGDKRKPALASKRATLNGNGHKPTEAEKLHAEDELVDNPDKMILDNIREDSTLEEILPKSSTRAVIKPHLVEHK